MLNLTSEIAIEGKLLEYETGDYNLRGDVTASQLNFTIPGDDVSRRKYWNKEVTFFLDKDDAYPMLRGRIVNAEIVDDYRVKFTAVDALGFLTGHQKATVVLTDNDNIDGLSIGAAIIKLIRLANLQDLIGTDYIGETNPVMKIGKKYRGATVILTLIKNELAKAIDTAIDIPREQVIQVVDDGTKAQLILGVQSKLDDSTVTYYYDNDNIMSFTVQNRKIPTTIVVKGDNSQGSFRHSSAATALGENFLTITNNNLTSKAACIDFGQKIYNANVENQYEYTLSTYSGPYLQPNDVVNIIEKNNEVEGNFRIIGKSIRFGPTKYSLDLTINKRPPILAQFLKSD
jgi:hypothetical protein